MGCAAEDTNEGRTSPSHCDEGWYFLRRNVSVQGKRYPAGTLVEHVLGEWFVHIEGGALVRRSLPIDASMVCRTSYGGVSLFEVWRVGEGLVYARPVLSDVTPQSVDPMTLNVALASGQSCVCVQFGRCFLPLEFFNW